MKSTDFGAIVSPIGAGSARRRKGALARYAEGGAVDYSDPNATIAALNRSLDALTTPPAGQGRDLAALGFSAGILSPTRSGSFLESLGSGYKGELGAIETDRNRALQAAHLRQSIPLTGLQAAGLAQNLKQQKLFLDALEDAMKDDNGSGPTVGITPSGKPVAAPPIAGTVPIGQPGGGPSGVPGTVQIPPIDAGAVNPGAPPGAAGSTLTAPPDQSGAGLRPVLTGGGPGDGAVSPAVATGLQQAAPPMQTFQGQEISRRPGVDARGMTVPSVDGALPIPAYLSQQYATLFNRMTRLAKNPLTAELASKYETMLKSLTQPGFAFLPDGSGLVPVGDKDPAYLERAKAANEMMRWDPTVGRYVNAPGSVAAAASKAGAIAGAQANAQLPAKLTEEQFRQTLTAKREAHKAAEDTFNQTGIWPPGYGPDAPPSQAVQTDKGTITPEGNMVPAAPTVQFRGAEEAKATTEKTKKREDDFDALRGGIDGAISRTKMLADAMKIVEGKGFNERRAQISNDLRGLGLGAVADMVMSKKDQNAVQTAIGAQVIDILQQLRNINQGSGGRILNSEFVNLLDRQYGPNLGAEANFNLVTQALAGFRQSRSMIDDYYKFGKPSGWRDAGAFQSAYYSDKANAYDHFVEDAKKEVGPLKGMKGFKAAQRAGTMPPPTGSTPGGAAAAAPAGNDPMGLR